MCLILIANDVHPRYRLVVAANRDEFYQRPTAPADWWPESPDVLAGRDLQSGGTWMGVTLDGRFAAITNFREPGATRDDAPSRGGLVLGALTTPSRLDDYLAQVDADGHRYNGFNLVAGDGGGLWVYSNRGDAPPRAVAKGVSGISNYLFDTPWPKVVKGRDELTAALELEGDELVDALLSLLEDREIPPDGELPDTGVGIEYERVLASKFIASSVYGTRASYAVLFDRSGEVTFVEQTFDRGEPAGDPIRFDFQMQFTA
jgi:uncharacterized protein with NRDE domain